MKYMIIMNAGVGPMGHLVWYPLSKGGQCLHKIVKETPTKVPSELLPVGNWVKY